MRLIILFGILSIFGCAEVLDHTQYSNGVQERAFPKSYRAPTHETLLDEQAWRHVGQLTAGGQTQIGVASELIGFDSSIGEGQDLVVRNFSAGWTSVHIFAWNPAIQVWETIRTQVQSTPIDADLEGGQIAFRAPFTGHYLFLLEPVDARNVDYLIRLDCDGDCP